MAGDSIGFGLDNRNYAEYVVVVNPVTGLAITSFGDGLTSSTASKSTVTSSATAGIVLAANSSRKGARLLNNSTAIFYGLYGVGVASASNYSFVLAPLTASPIVPVGLPSYEDIPAGFTGLVSGVWASANGSLLITEFV